MLECTTASIDLSQRAMRAARPSRGSEPARIRQAGPNIASREEPDTPGDEPGDAGPSRRWLAPLIYSCTRQCTQVRDALRSRSDDPLHHLRFGGWRSV